MRRKLYGLAAALLLTLLPGCLARTAVDLATLPVRVVGKGIDAVYESQAERDHKRGKRERKAEEKAAREANRMARSTVGTD